MRDYVVSFLKNFAMRSKFSGFNFTIVNTMYIYSCYCVENCENSTFIKFVKSSLLL